MPTPYPDRILAFLASVWTWLELYVHPVAPWALTLGLIFGVQLAVRTWAPHAWQTVAEAGPTGKAASKAWQALPSVMAGAIVVSLGTGANLTLTATGALLALAAPVGHELLKWATSKLPGPTYVGGNWPAAGSAPLKLGETYTAPGAGSGQALPPIDDDDTGGTPLPPAAGVLLLIGLGLSQVCCAGSLVDAQRDALAQRYGANTAETGYAPSQRCQELSDRHSSASAWAQFFGYLAGGSGVAALPANELPDEYRGPAIYTAAGSAAVAGGAAAYFAQRAAAAAAEFTEHCLP